MVGEFRAALSVQVGQMPLCGSACPWTSWRKARQAGGRQRFSALSTMIPPSLYEQDHRPLCGRSVDPVHRLFQCLDRHMHVASVHPVVHVVQDHMRRAIIPSLPELSPNVFACPNSTEHLENSMPSRQWRPRKGTASWRRPPLRQYISSTPFFSDPMLRCTYPSCTDFFACPSTAAQTPDCTPLFSISVAA